MTRKSRQRKEMFWTTVSAVSLTAVATAFALVALKFVVFA